MEMRLELILAIGIILASFAGISSSTEDGPLEITRADPALRYGGEIVEEFQNGSMIEELDSCEHTTQGIMPYVEPFTDFENYTDEKNIVGDNGWEWHTAWNAGSFSAETSRVYGSDSIIAEHRNGDSNTNSMVFTKDFAMSKGIIMIDAATTMVDPTDHATTRIHLLGTDSLNPGNEDRIAQIGFVHNGIYCYNGVWNRVLASASSGVWYTITISFDCNLKEITVTASQGDQSGQVTCAFDNDFGKLRRIGLLTGKDVAYTDITSYWDDLRVFTEYPESYMVSKNLTLPDGMSWRNLVLKGTIYGDSGINVTLLKGDMTPISGFTPVENRMEYDISFLCAMNIRTMRIKAMLTSTGSYCAFNGWTVEYNSTSAWREGFFTESSVLDERNIELDNGRIRLDTTETIGYVLLENISLPTSYYWNKLYFGSEGGPRDVEFQFLNARTGRLISSYYNSEGPEIDISEIESIENDMVQLRIVLYRGTLSPSVSVVAISWKIDQRPTLKEYTIPSEVYRTMSNEMVFTPWDPEQPAGELSLSIRYLSPDGFTYGDEYLHDFRFLKDSNSYALTFTPPAEAQLGEYDILVTITDELGLFTETVLPDAITVLNNLPTDPMIAIEPKNPTTESRLETVLTVPSADADADELLYTYRVFINDVLRTDLGKKNVLSMDTVVILPSATRKHDRIRIEVNVTDGTNTTQTYAATTQIRNSPPELRTQETIFSLLDEDTIDDSQIVFSDLVMDRDGDELTFTFGNDENLELEIDPDTLTLTVTPAEDYYGTQIVPVTVNDGDSDLLFDITVYVLPVNDPPFGTVVSPVNLTKATVGDVIQLSAQYEDPDDPHAYLDCVWKANGMIVGEGEQASFSPDTPGLFTVTCTVSDAEFEIEIGSFDITVMKPIPPFTEDEARASYTKSSPPVRMEVRSAAGEPAKADNQHVDGVNITGLTMTAMESDVIIEMTLNGNVLPSSAAWDSGGSRGIYRVFFVKGPFVEAAYDPKTLNLNDLDRFVPSPTDRIAVGEGYLSYGEGSGYGSPTVAGNRITWTIPMADLVDAGAEPPFHLFGTSSGWIPTEDLTIGAMDSIGHGSTTHTTSIKASSSSDEDGGGVSIAVLIVLLVLFLIIGAAVGAAAMVFLKKGTGEKDKDREATEGTTVPAPMVPSGPIAPVPPAPVRPNAPVPPPVPQTQPDQPVSQPPQPQVQPPQ